MSQQARQAVPDGESVPTMVIPLPRTILNNLKERRFRNDVAHQEGMAELGNLIHDYYAGVQSDASATADAFENYRATFYAETLPNRRSWCLHAAAVGHAVVLHAGHLRGLTGEDPLPDEKFPDEIAWIFRENLNEAWAFVFRDEIRDVLELNHRGKVLCRIRFSVVDDG